MTTRGSFFLQAHLVRRHADADQVIGFQHLQRFLFCQAQLSPCSPGVYAVIIIILSDDALQIRICPVSALGGTQFVVSCIGLAIADRASPFDAAGFGYQSQFGGKAIVEFEAGQIFAA